LDLSRRAAEICRPADYFLNEPTADWGQQRKSRQLGATLSVIRQLSGCYQKLSSKMGREQRGVFLAAMRLPIGALRASGAAVQ